MPLYNVPSGARAGRGKSVKSISIEGSNHGHATGIDYHEGVRFHMSADRIEVLKGMIAQDPGNAFARYGLAMEYFRTERLEDAAAEFETLMNSHPDYAASYYHAGRTLEKLGRIEDARAVMERGVEVTTRLGDHHTRSELQAALDLLGF